MKTKIPALLFAVTVVAYSCISDETPLKTVSLELPSTPYPYNVGTNDYLPTLGRVLFYDKQLSINNSVSCSSCHKQNLAFADNVRFSKGFENTFTTRNSMPIQNLGSASFFPDSGFNNPGPIEFGTSLFWDGREHNLQSMVLKPIVNHIEMGMTDLEALTERLSVLSYYKDLFVKAYGQPVITSDRIAEALSLFLLSINSGRSKFDHSMQGTEKLGILEKEGLHLFDSTYNCNSCHQVQSVHGYIFAGTFANIGLDEEYTDTGLAAVTRSPSDVGKFKIPSLRNVSLTGPYMHDGRFATLDEVLEHYSHGVADHPNLDFRLRDNNGQPILREIPVQDKKAIIAFLRTLTDYEMISDEKFSNPFNTK